jgi:hypothetical protein
MKQTPGLRRRAIFLCWRESEEAIKNLCWELFRNISNGQSRGWRCPNPVFFRPLIGPVYLSA